MEEPPVVAAAPPGVGSVIGGKYRLVAPVAEGGMGAVWRAEDLRLAAPVAVKLLHARHSRHPETRARFAAEAAIGAQLRSPHVVQVFERGVDAATDLPFIAMELLEGESLQERLARAGPMAPAELLRLVSQVARALTRAHALGVVHRDLKPENIFLVRDGETELVKLLDFGIAKRFTGSSGRTRTVTGDLLGTPTYMSPEQITGSKTIDHRSDLWSLAVIAVECLTGRLPFDAEHLAGLALAICQGRSLLPSSLGPVPRGFDAWFEQATALRVEARFDSAAQLAEALRSVCGGQLVSSDDAAPAGAPDRAASAPPLGTARLGTARLSTARLSTVLLRTVHLLRPQQLLRLRARRRRLWAALGAGALLVLLALSVRLPASSAPRIQTVSSLAAPRAPLDVATPHDDAQQATSALPPATGAAQTTAARAEAATPEHVVPEPRAATPLLPPQPPPAQSTAPRRKDAAASRAPAARPRPALDPDNLGF